MLKKKVFIPILAFTCLLSMTACNKKDNMEIKPISMNMDINEVPYENLEREWSNMTMDKYILRVAQQIWSTWNDLDKIWPGVDFSKYNVLYVEANGNNAWLISSDKEINKLNAKDLPDKFKAQGNPFMFSSSENTLNGKPTIKVEVDPEMFNNPYDNGEFKALPNSSMLFTFTVHEEFHNYQSTWKIKETDQEELLTKGVENFSARTQRLEIINALNKAILEPEKEQQYLESAKWWFEEYKKNNKEEYELTKSIDILEGTARYFDMATNMRSIEGLSISEEEAFKFYQDMIREDYNLDAERFFGLPDEEAYDIGGSSGVLLEKQNNLDWKKEAQQGTPPLEILLKDYKAVPQQPSQEVENLVKSIQERRKALENTEE